MRRSVLACVLSLLLAGCVGGPAADAVDGPTSCEPTGSVPAMTNDSRPYPSLPDSLNLTTALAYTTDFEEAFAYHDHNATGVDEIHVRTSGYGVRAVDAGYVVEIEDVEVSTYEERPEAGQVGSDAWSAVYLVNDSTVLRGEGRAGDGETPPRSEWRTVCE